MDESDWMIQEETVIQIIEYGYSETEAQYLLNLKLTVDC